MHFTDVGAFIQDYGASLDRIGDPGGKYLGVRIDGKPDSFEARGLPVGSLSGEYHRYEFTGQMPAGWKIEISEIAPAFGREGGGLQVLVLDDAGVVRKVTDLMRLKVLREDE